MAEIVKEQINWIRQPNYPWDTWLDGQQWRLRQGSDFVGDIKSFQCAAHRAASTRGGRVRTRADGRTVILQFYKPKASRKRA